VQSHLESFPILRDQARELLSGQSVAYASDYYSFVGADDLGRVAFAIDTNRGRDGGAYQAEHLYAVLYDERTDWVRLNGIGRFQLQMPDLLAMPSSEAFSFAGAIEDEIVIDSPSNELRLKTSPVATRFVRTRGETIVAWGSAGASLQWKQRTVAGRVIYEYLIHGGRNPMVRRSLRTLTELGRFEGLYLVGGTADDVYVQWTSRSLAAGLDPVLGFVVRNEQTLSLESSTFETTRDHWARGVYRWPAAWRVHGRLGEQSFTLEVESQTARPVFNWYIAGFGMQIVAGELEVGGEIGPVYGFAEVLALGPIVHRLGPP
jgi:hypothetical protein